VLNTIAGVFFLLIGIVAIIFSINAKGDSGFDIYSKFRTISGGLLAYYFSYSAVIL